MLEALWLRFVTAREVGRLRCSSTRLRDLLEDAALLVETTTTTPDREIALTLMSTSPQILFGADFLSDKECRALIAIGRIASAAAPALKSRLRARQLRFKHYVALGEGWTWLPPRANRVVRSIAARVYAVTKSRSADELELNFTPAVAASSAPPDALSGEPTTLDARLWFLSQAGVHVDVNNGFPHRFVTVLCYLNDIPSHLGGATCFPAAGRRGRLDAAERLLGRGVHHTDAALNQDEDESLFDDGCEVVAAAAALCREENKNLPGGGLRLQPRRGAACVFWSLDDSATLEAAAFHGGARVLTTEDDASRRDFWSRGKWTLQCFKQLPEHLRDSTSPVAVREFVRASRRCIAGGGGGVRFTVALPPTEKSTAP